ncbi:MAG: type VI secretion system contractile sheath small subunit [Planctomycetes bacterium]|nr:type VI secretion system contractile sheath small subunit [Planctomycetota bacterium]
MPPSQGQKYIGQNRKPRVQIEYEVDTGGAIRKVEIPFVVAVMSDLSGQSVVDKGRVSDRDFLEFDAGNLDRRMEAIKPRVAFEVDDKLSGDPDKKLRVDLTFESIEDFKPDRVAAKDPTLRKLYEKRQRLENLLAFLDTSPDAEEVLQKALENDALMKAITSERASGEEPKPAE